MKLKINSLLLPPEKLKLKTFIEDLYKDGTFCIILFKKNKAFYLFEKITSSGFLLNQKLNFLLNNQNFDFGVIYDPEKKEIFISNDNINLDNIENKEYLFHLAET